MKADRISQLSPREQEALLRALLTVFSRPDCKGRALSLEELPRLLTQAGFDASRCSPALLEDALCFCSSCRFLDSFEQAPAPCGGHTFTVKGLTPFGRWRVQGKDTLTFVGFNGRSLLVTAVGILFFLLFLRLLSAL